jgi:hypothetical protein
MTPKDITGVVPISEMIGDAPEETARLRNDLEYAKAFLLNHRWCIGLGECYFGVGLGSVIAAFLIEISPRPDGVDQWLWVIVGDIPPAYLVLDEAKDPISAVKLYIDLMEEWVELARAGEASDKVIPVNRAPTPEYAEELQRRLDAIRCHILPWLEGGSTVH